uniref:ubiquitinyl hydrolase 1 n=1 Tax=Macrostomum lignano TaxID=282301 RepID=A0A1I8F9D5_9PLAT
RKHTVRAVFLRPVQATRAKSRRAWATRHRRTIHQAAKASLTPDIEFNSTTVVATVNEAACQNFSAFTAASGVCRIRCDSQHSADGMAVERVLKSQKQKCAQCDSMARVHACLLCVHFGCYGNGHIQGHVDAAHPAGGSQARLSVDLSSGQALVHTPVLRDFFLLDPHSSLREHPALSCLVLPDYFGEFYSDCDNPFVPSSTLHLIWVHAHHLAGYEQQDAHEFLMAALNLLHQHFQADSGSGEPNGCTVGHQLQLQQQRSPCRCIVDQVFSGVPHCLQVHRPEHRGKIRCFRCQTVQDSIKQLTFRKLPVVACFHFKRFQHACLNHRKISTHISFPELLDMTPRLGKQYRLFCVVNHSGSLSAGHYTCYVCGTICNNLISDVPVSEVLTSEGYLLFYHKIVKRAQQAVKILPARQAVCPRICAPMVRYSKLPFRYLMRQLRLRPVLHAYDRRFVLSVLRQGRDNEFVTGPGDRPLIVQFASNDPAEFAACCVQFGRAALRRRGFEFAAVRNAGPISRILAFVLCSQPQLLAEMLTAARGRRCDCPNKFALSAKIRLCPDMRDTERLC